MTAFIVVSWAAYARAERRPAWGLVAGVAAVLAFFTKAAAAFFVAAIALDARLTGAADAAPGSPGRRARVADAAGLALAAAAAAAFFVLPHWSQYQFYNWQMSGDAKTGVCAARPRRSRVVAAARAGHLHAHVAAVLVAAVSLAAIVVARWRASPPAERLLVLWLLVGIARAHRPRLGQRAPIRDVHSGVRWRWLPLLDSIRRSAVAGPASLPSASARTRCARHGAPAPAARVSRRSASLRAAVLSRGDRERRRVPDHGPAVGRAWRSSLTLAVRWRGPPSTRWLVKGAAASRRWSGPRSVTMAGECGRYGAWARRRQRVNYRASVEIGRVLPPGTLVQGKLANGMALENRIRPVFVGNGFGNYADRFDARDARYILTYDVPRIGYESSAGSGLIQEHPRPLSEPSQ